MPSGIYNPRAETERTITPGTDYNVYGIIVSKGLTYFYICTDDYSDTGSLSYPHWRPAPFFQILNSAVSSTWHVTYHSIEYHTEGVLLVAPKAWVDDTFFYDKLTDGFDQNVRNAWLSMKDAIDSETSI